MKAAVSGMLSGRIGLQMCTLVVVEVLLLHLLFGGVYSQNKQTVFNTTQQAGQKPGDRAVELRVDKNNVIVDNGIFQVSFTKPQGQIQRITYNGMTNILNAKENRRGYWDVMWKDQKKELRADRIQGTQFNIITQTKEQVEISFVRKWNLSLRRSAVPLTVDRRYIIRRGVSGIYMYGVFERLAGWPDADMDQIRAVFRLDPHKFNYMAMSDTRQRSMPSEEDRVPRRGHAKKLDFKEAVLLTNPRNPMFKGEVDDKYMYSSESKDDKVHGWISMNPHVGFWMITPSDEFRNGGPMKQDLTSHTGPTTLAMFTSTHYAGDTMDKKFRNGEAWKKVFGPVFVYLNSVPPTDNNATANLWNDAKRQMFKEVESWPYSFVRSVDYPLARQRGTVSGQLFVKDSYVSKTNMFAKFGYVGLAPPGEAGSWQIDTKGYQFWTQADNMGRFIIDKIRPGNYSVFAWVPGCIGDYKYEKDVTITPGSKMNLGNLVYEPPRSGPTLWEIGVPDRTAAEFLIPDPDPSLLNKLYLNKSEHRFRQYGLWHRYASLHPRNDLVFTVGKSDYRKHWFFAHVNRQTNGKNRYKAATWKIIFNIKEVDKTKTYTLQLALASSTNAEIKVQINKADSEPVLLTGLMGKDNAIARHGIHGLYRLFSVGVPGDLLRIGDIRVRD